MTKDSFRVAIWVVIAFLVIVAGAERTVVSAADCEIPTFLAMGKTYNFGYLMGDLSITVAEIDRQTCWVKGQWKKGNKSGTTWFNLRQVTTIAEEQAPPAQAQPGQRR
jgi:hypothetical protein